MKTHTKRKLTLLACSTVMVALVSGGAIADTKEGKGCKHDRDGKHAEKKHKRHLSRMSKKLELSDEQKTQVETIMDTQHAKMLEQREKHLADLTAEMAKVLDAEQLEMFEKMMAKHDRRHH